MNSLQSRLRTSSLSILFTHKMAKATTPLSYASSFLQAGHGTSSRLRKRQTATICSMA